MQWKLVSTSVLIMGGVWFVLEHQNLKTQKDQSDRSVIVDYVNNGKNDLGKERSRVFEDEKSSANLPSKSTGLQSYHIEKLKAAEVLKQKVKERSKVFASMGMVTFQYEQQKKQLQDEAKALLGSNYSAQHLKGLTNENPEKLVQVNDRETKLTEDYLAKLKNINNNLRRNSYE